MIALAKRATPAAIAVLRQATALWPKRKKASDGLLPSRAHVKQNPNSDHNSGFAVDLTHDPKNGVYCQVIYTGSGLMKRVNVNTPVPTLTTHICTSRSKRRVDMTPHLGFLG
jgi:hypothetical protein